MIKFIKAMWNKYFPSCPHDSEIRTAFFNVGMNKAYICAKCNKVINIV